MKDPALAILVAEDDEHDQFFIRQALNASGWEGTIQIVSNGDEAIAYLEAKGPFANRTKFKFPSLLITDLKMPGRDGFDILSHLRTTQDTCYLPAFVLSSSDDPSDIKRAYELGARGYFQKPPTPRSLNEIIRTLIEFWTQCKLPSR